MSVYDLIMQDRNGQKHVLKYNPHTSDLKCVDGTDVILPEPKIWDPVDKVSPSNPGKKIRAPKKLKIQLGLKCNMKCSYCSQSVHVESAINTNLADAKIFIKNLDKWLEGEPERIEFWGGEPLLYWKKIKFLLEELGKRFSKTQYVIITNGTLIDDEFIEFVQTYDINVAISHDGPGQALRGDDPFQNPAQFEMIKKFYAARSGRMSFNVVLTPNNIDLNAVFKFFRERLDENVRVEFEGVVTSYADSPEFVTGFTPAQYEQLTFNLADMIFRAQADDKTKTLPNTIMSRIVSFAMSLKYRRPSYALGQKCGMDKEDNLACDLLGNIMTCQNTTSDKNHRLGHVMLMDQVKLDTSWHWSNRDECSNCPVLQLCGGSCMYLPNDFNWFHSCSSEYAYNMGILAGALFIITDGWVLKEVNGKIARPDPAMLEIRTPIVAEKKKQDGPILNGWIWEVIHAENTPNMFYVYKRRWFNSDTDVEYEMTQTGKTVIPEDQLYGLEEPDFKEEVINHLSSLIDNKTPVIQFRNDKYIYVRANEAA
jgi:uncharacterized protein